MSVPVSCSVLLLITCRTHLQESNLNIESPLTGFYDVPMKENGWSFLPPTTYKRQSGYLITRLREQHHIHLCQNIVVVRRADSFLQRSFFYFFFNVARRAKPMSADNYFGPRCSGVWWISWTRTETLSPASGKSASFWTRQLFSSGELRSEIAFWGISANVFGFTSHWQTADQRRWGEGAQAGCRVSPLTSASDLITIWRNLAGIRRQPYKVWTTDSTPFEAIY